MIENFISHIEPIKVASILNKKFIPYGFFIVALLSFFSTTLKAQTKLSPEDMAYYISVLERKSELQNDSMHTLERNLFNAKVVMLKENLRKKAWIKVAIGEMVLGTGILIGFVTGAWVPVIMGTAMIELYLLIEGKYRLNIKKLKIIRLEANKKKLSDYIR
jgi:hypothetical protein